jgi:hypothetical protein
VRDIVPLDADLSGGNGKAAGGLASFPTMTVNTYADRGAVTDALGQTYLPVGPIYNELAIIARGGGATDVGSLGGQGGYITWTTKPSSTATPADS